MEMHGKECYTCGEIGHVSSNCPRNSSGYKNKKRKISSSIAQITPIPTFPRTQCRCGGGFCKIKLISKAKKYFYCCPNINEMHCRYFKWCHELKEREILNYPPPTYPCCSCGAGICRLETIRTEGPNFGRKYFACRIKKGQGACNFWQWQVDHYPPTFDLDNASIDNSMAEEIDRIQREIANGEINPDYPPLVEMEINAHSTPSPSSTSPLDREALTPIDSYGKVVKWYLKH